MQRRAGTGRKTGDIRPFIDRGAFALDRARKPAHQPARMEVRRVLVIDRALRAGDPDHGIGLGPVEQLDAVAEPERFEFGVRFPDRRQLLGPRATVNPPPLTN